MKDHYLALGEHVPQVDNLGSYDMAVTNETKPEDSAWGEEIVDSFETASELVSALAGEFSIMQACIKVEIRMHNHKHGTRH